MSVAVAGELIYARDPGTIPRIVFDTWVLGSHARHHGIHVYARELLSNFRQIAREYPAEIWSYISRDGSNVASDFGEAPGFRNESTRLLGRTRLWRWGGALCRTMTTGADLVFSPNCTTLYVGSLMPTVVTIHDLSPLAVHWGPQRIARTLRFLLRRAAKYSQAVITDSFHSKTDLIDRYSIPESRVSVVYLGCDKKRFNAYPEDSDAIAVVLRRLGVVRPYILHHGLIKPYKNLTRLIEAYRLLLERNRNLDCDLVLAGRLGWEYDDVLAEAHRCEGSRARVIFTGAVSDADLARLIKGANVCVIPSLYEGFCLPLVEAMACGIPTICSNAACLPEISGGVLRYFDPHSTDEMAACMEQALENAELRRELSSKGIERAARFDWERCARETLDILVRLACENRQSRRSAAR